MVANVFALVRSLTHTLTITNTITKIEIPSRDSCDDRMFNRAKKNVFIDMVCTR